MPEVFLLPSRPPFFPSLYISFFFPFICLFLFPNYFLSFFLPNFHPRNCIEILKLILHSTHDYIGTKNRMLLLYGKRNRRLKVVAAVVMKSSVFWDITPHSLFESQPTFRRNILPPLGRRISQERNQRERSGKQSRP
jgi:hypothetical protein